MSNTSTFFSKLGKVVLIVYVTLATVAAFLFGFLYISEKNRDGLTISGARELLTTICYDLETAYNNSAASGRNSSISTTAIEPEEYLGDDLFAETTINPLSLIQFLQMARAATTSEYKERTYYRSAVEFFPNEPSSTFEIEAYIHIDIQGNSIKINLVQFTESNDGSRIASAMYLDVAKEENDSWSLSYYAYPLTEDVSYDTEYEISNNFYFMYARGNVAGAYVFGVYRFINTTGDFSDLSISNIQDLSMYYCDIENNQLLNLEQAQMEETDIVSQAQGMYDMFQTESDGIVSFVDIQPESSTFLYDAYLATGMIDVGLVQE